MADIDRKQSRAPLPPRRAADPRFPHPSWRQTISGSDQGAGRIVNAGEFWKRLGI